MEPNFHIGDLVIVHSESEYEVGDAVVYRNQQLENFVSHRIIAGQLGKFTLQGDNNTWVDTYQPDRTEILGKLWLHIPQGGVLFQKIREPLVMALAAGLLGGSLALSFLAGRSKGKNQMNKDNLTTLQQKIGDWAARLSASAPTPRSDSDPTPVVGGLVLRAGTARLRVAGAGHSFFFKTGHAHREQRPAV